MLPAMVFAACLLLQAAKVPEAPAPAGAPLPSKGKVTPKELDSELEGSVKEDGLMSFARYEGGSFSLKQAKVTIYVNRREIVLVQGKQRLAVPVNRIAEILDGDGVYSRVSKATGNGIPSTGMKNQSAGNLTIVGIIWSDSEKKNGVVLRLDKGDFPGFVSALQDVTGLKVVNTIR